MNKNLLHLSKSIEELTPVRIRQFQRQPTANRHTPTGNGTDRNLFFSASIKPRTPKFLGKADVYQLIELSPYAWLSPHLIEFVENSSHKAIIGGYTYEIFYTTKKPYNECGINDLEIIHVYTAPNGSKRQETETFAEQILVGKHITPGIARGLILKLRTLGYIGQLQQRFADCEPAEKVDILSELLEAIYPSSQYTELKIPHPVMGIKKVVDNSEARMNSQRRYVALLLSSPRYLDLARMPVVDLSDPEDIIAFIRQSLMGNKIDLLREYQDTHQDLAAQLQNFAKTINTDLLVFYLGFRSRDIVTREDIEFLIGNGVSIDLQNKHLIESVLNLQNLSLIKYFLDMQIPNTIEPTIKYCINLHGNPDLIEFACANANLDLLQVLQSYGVNFQRFANSYINTLISSKSEITTIIRMLEYIKTIFSIDYTQITPNPTLIAARENKPELVEYFGVNDAAWPLFDKYYKFKGVDFAKLHNTPELKRLFPGESQALSCESAKFDVVSVIRGMFNGVPSILLGRKQNMHTGQLDPYYLFPGGGCDATDTDFVATARRETREETELDLSGGRILHIYDEVINGRRACKVFVLFEDVDFNQQSPRARDDLAEVTIVPITDCREQVINGVTKRYVGDTLILPSNGVFLQDNLSELDRLCQIEVFGHQLMCQAIENNDIAEIKLLQAHGVQILRRFDTDESLSLACKFSDIRTIKFVYDEVIKVMPDIIEHITTHPLVHCVKRDLELSVMEIFDLNAESCLELIYAALEAKSIDYLQLLTDKLIQLDPPLSARQVLTKQMTGKPGLFTYACKVKFLQGLQHLLSKVDGELEFTENPLHAALELDSSYVLELLKHDFDINQVEEQCGGRERMAHDFLNTLLAVKRRDFVSLFDRDYDNNATNHPLLVAMVNNRQDVIPRIRDHSRYDEQKFMQSYYQLEADNADLARLLIDRNPEIFSGLKQQKMRPA